MNLIGKVLMSKAEKLPILRKVQKTPFWLTQKSGKKGERGLQNETIQKWH